MSIRSFIKRRVPDPNWIRSLIAPKDWYRIDVVIGKKLIRGRNLDSIRCEKKTGFGSRNLVLTSMNQQQRWRKSDQ